jgi:hypothetical protein
MKGRKCFSKESTQRGVVEVFRGSRSQPGRRQEIALTRRVVAWAASNSTPKSRLAGAGRKKIPGCLGCQPELGLGSAMSSDC